MNGVLRSAALSDIGCRRSNNEDSFGYDEALQVYVVSDGMGGSAGGEIASHICVKETLESFALMRGAYPDFSPSELLYHSICKANAAVYSVACTDSSLRGMGATLVAVCFAGRRAMVANVGDSRAYLLRQKSCTQITRDHSLAEEQIRLGLMTPEQAARSSIATTITRAMGIGPHIEPDLFTAELSPGDMLLLASDGLMRHVSDPEIASLVAEAGEPQGGCAVLVETTRQRGAGDNVTCLLVEIG